MKIFVKTVGTLKSLEEGTAFVAMEFPDETAVHRIIDHLDLKEEVGFILINGSPGQPETILREGDKLTLIAPLVGG